MRLDLRRGMRGDRVMRGFLLKPLRGDLVYLFFSVGLLNLNGRFA